MPNFYVNSKFYVEEIKGKYYVYSIEKDEGGKQRHHYIAPLERIIEIYVNIGSGVSPTTPRPGFEPGSRARQAPILDR
jgi:ORF D-335-like protein.